MAGSGDTIVKGLKISVERPDATLTVLRLTGEFEGVSALNAQAEMLGALDANVSENFMLDFSEISYIDSAALGILLQMARSATSRGIKFGLLNVHDPVKKVLTITKVDKILTIYNS